MTLTWTAAREAAYAAGVAARPEAVDVALARADHHVLAGDVTPLTDLPSFPTSSVDGYAVRGPEPWTVVGRALAGTIPIALTDSGTALEIATGSMVPAGTDAVIRVEDSTVSSDGRVSGSARPTPDWREQGDEAAKGEVLLPAGTPVTPAVIGLAAACGHDTLPVYPAPHVGLVVFGDELLNSGPPGDGRVRDSLGPQIPSWLTRLGATMHPEFEPLGPVADTLEAHVAALRSALSACDVICTTGGTMHGPVDHLHATLTELGATYIANTVAVRPGFPMLLASVPRPGRPPAFVAGLPGNPQSAVIAIVSLVAPLLAGLTGSSLPSLTVELGADVPGRGTNAHLALVRLSPDGLAFPMAHVGSAMLRGLAQSDGFAVIAPSAVGTAGDRVPFVPLPLYPGGRP